MFSSASTDRAECALTYRINSIGSGQSLSWLPDARFGDAFVRRFFFGGPLWFNFCRTRSTSSSRSNGFGMISTPSTSPGLGCAVTSTVEQPRFPEVEQVLNEKLGEAMFGDITPEEAVQQAAAEGEEIIDEG